MRNINLKDNFHLYLPGFCFILIHLWPSYMFHSVNNYKLMLTCIGIFLIFLTVDVKFLFTNQSKVYAPNWKLFLILLLPTFLVLPGIVFHGVNYSFYFELTSNLAIVLWVFYLVRIFDNQKKFYILFYLLGGLVLYTSLWSFLEKYHLHPLWWIYGEDIKSAFGYLQRFPIEATRAKSTFGNQNYYAGFLAILTPIFLSISIPLTKKTWNEFVKSKEFYFSICTISLFASLYFSLSRGAVLGSIAAFSLFGILFIWISIKSRKIRVIVTSSILGFAFFLAAFFFLVAFSNIEFPENALTSRISQIGSKETIQGRIIPWVAAIRAFKEAPFFGFGLGSYYNQYFLNVSPEIHLRIWARMSYNHAHGEILEYLVEGGIFGIIGLFSYWIFILGALIYLIFRIEDKFFQRLSIGILCGLVAYFVQGLFSVAPRYMVVRVTENTAIALVFIMLRIYFQKTRDYEGKIKRFYFNILPNQVINSSDFFTRFKWVLPQTMIFVFFLSFLAPWLYARYSFIQQVTKIRNYNDVKKLEKISDMSPNVYVLQYLLRYEINAKQFYKAQKILRRFEDLMPNYLQMRYVSAAIHFYERDYLSAREKALDFQKSYYYNEKLIILLMKLAVLQKDQKLFEDQIRYSMWFDLLPDSIPGAKYKEDLDIRFVPRIRNAELIKKGDRYLLLIPKRISQFLFQSAQKIVYGGKIKDQERLKDFFEKQIPDFSAYYIPDKLSAKDVQQVKQMFPTSYFVQRLLIPNSNNSKLKLEELKSRNESFKDEVAKIKVGSTPLDREVLELLNRVLSWSGKQIRLFD